ncbi:acetolactate synthase large subunit [Bordetella ansorpii]|uniref:Acetolactate synthase large subunit n=1 Tax=Bordetella ansorpii TaxID=288768 RepID=A0A157ME65_9BORD|nr:thiamine pyrophosphate-binding protein [Bordetella ansorpii]SAI07392.1 acetolactate synthase large subunit [Bordetella ansorpii]
MSGAHLVTRALSRAGVKTVFSLSGNQIMPIYDACIDAGIRIVHVRHEAAAVHMADAWAQLTGEIGVALLTAAPGITNGLSPLYSARMAESPVLVLSGDSPMSADGTGPFQELAQTEITKPLVKRALRPTRAAELDRDVTEAIECALSGRPGPVHVALPFDLLSQDVQDSDAPGPAAPRRQSTALAPQAAQAIAQRVGQAKRPLVLVGPMLNASRAPGLLARARQALQAPVIPMESPRGLRDPSLGTFASCLADADLVLLLGKPLDFTVAHGKTPAFHAQAGVIVVDPEAFLLERAVKGLGARLREHAQADADDALQALCEAAAQASSPRADWLARVDAAIASRQLVAGTGGLPDAAQPLPQAICGAVQQALDQADEPILICDGGEFGQWAQAFCQAPTRVINGVSGAIGGALCYAIAASLARPDATIFTLMGDGTVGFHLSEFETAAREGARFVAVVGNDARWNAEHVIQMREYGADRLYGCQLSAAARYDQAAQALGAHGGYADRLADVAGVIDAALHSGKPACLDIRMDGQAAPSFASTGVAAQGPH